MTFRNEIMNALDQYGIPLEISYKIDGKKLEMTGSISMYGMKKALTIVFTKL